MIGLQSGQLCFGLFDFGLGAGGLQQARAALLLQVGQPANISVIPKLALKERRKNRKKMKKGIITLHFTISRCLQILHDFTVSWSDSCRIFIFGSTSSHQNRHLRSAFWITGVTRAVSPSWIKCSSCCRASSKACSASSVDVRHVRLRCSLHGHLVGVILSDLKCGLYKNKTED